MDWAAIAALIISASTLGLGGLGLRQKASKDYADMLGTEIAVLRASLEQCRKHMMDCDEDRRQVHEEVFELRQRLRGLGDQASDIGTKVQAKIGAIELAITELKALATRRVDRS